jgi:predicted glycosyltransferase
MFQTQETVMQTGESVAASSSSSVTRAVKLCNINRHSNPSIALIIMNKRLARVLEGLLAK